MRAGQSPSALRASVVRVNVGRRTPMGRWAGKLWSGLRVGVGRLDASKIWDPRSGSRDLGCIELCFGEFRQRLTECVGRLDASEIWDPRSRMHRIMLFCFLGFRVMIYLGAAKCIRHSGACRRGRCAIAAMSPGVGDIACSPRSAARTHPRIPPISLGFRV